MPKPRVNELIRCRYFQWRLSERQGVWQADGRSNPRSAGRHSLGTGDRTIAMNLLQQLDVTIAADFGLAPRPQQNTPPVVQMLSLEAGRKLYETHIKRPRVAGGVRASTQKRYRTVFDKFLIYSKTVSIFNWNDVTNQTLIGYLSYLEKKKYAGKTLRNEMTVLVQTSKWLVKEKHLLGVEPLHMKMKKVESERAYCYTPAEVEAMVEHCRINDALNWLRDIIIALACTGLRISELASLRWSDIDLANNRLSLTDESNRSVSQGRKNRETKSGRSRHLPLHPDLAALLATKSRTGKQVFLGPRGGGLKPDTVRRILVRDVVTPLATRFPSGKDDQGFKEGRLHSFRHYFASMCAINGVPERVAMDWLGHQDSAMVRHYFHLNDLESRRQMERLKPVGTTGNWLAGNVNGAKENKKEGEANPEEPDSKDESRPRD